MDTPNELGSHQAGMLYTPRLIYKMFIRAACGTILSIVLRLLHAGNLSRARHPNPKTATVTARKNADANKVRQTAAKAARRAKQAAQAAQEATKKVADIVMAGLKALWAATQTLVAAIAAGGTAAVVIIIIICMIALVVGSSFRHFLRRGIHRYPASPSKRRLPN